MTAISIHDGSSMIWLKYIAKLDLFLKICKNIKLVSLGVIII